MNKYSSEAQEVIARTMKRFQDGQLKTSSGERVTNPKQAAAISAAEIRRKHLKAPNK